MPLAQAQSPIIERICSDSINVAVPAGAYSNANQVTYTKGTSCLSPAPHGVTITNVFRPKKICIMQKAQRAPHVVSHFLVSLRYHGREDSGPNHRREGNPVQKYPRPARYPQFGSTRALTCRASSGSLPKTVRLLTRFGTFGCQATALTGRAHGSRGGVAGRTE
ncbi:hypothetical protein VTG60DRAFT_5077 [Thermothelomyces hinnuleus]